MTYEWQLTVFVTERSGLRVLQWAGSSTSVPTWFGHNDLTESVFNSWLDTPDGRRWGHNVDSHNLFAVRTS